ncbi:MAG: DNA-directed RNA polymerase subunit H [archaeon]
MNKNLILEHELVPRHEILSREEADAVLKNLGATIDELPKIRDSDPVVKAIDAKRGNVLRITRKSPTAGETVYYRVVI